MTAVEFDRCRINVGAAKKEQQARDCRLSVERAIAIAEESPGDSLALLHVAAAAVAVVRPALSQNSESRRQCRAQAHAAETCAAW